MVNLVKTKDADGLIGRALTLDMRSYKYVEQKLFLALGPQPFWCLECGGQLLDPNDYESIQDIHICPFCKNVKNFGFSYWQNGLKLNMSLDVNINAEVASVSIMLVMLMEIAQKHGVKLNFFLNCVPIP